MKVLVIGDTIFDRYSYLKVQGLTSKNKIISGRFLSEETQTGGALAVFGQPLVKGAKVTAEIVRHGRTRSITVFKKKRRKNYRRTRGHRQGFTSLRITGIATA